MKLIICCFLLSLAIGAGGCSNIADSMPPSPEPVAHIEDYYLPLKNVGISYAYCRKSTSGADTLFMTMQGNDAAAVMLGNETCYSTDLTKTNRYLNNYYYAMNDSEAYTLGRVSCGGTDNFWLDLKAPLMIGQSWTFTNTNGNPSLYTANVTRRGMQMKMPSGTIYNDVAEVVYTSSTDSTVKWFARGIGLIYSTSTTPTSDFGDEMWLIAQN